MFNLTFKSGKGEEGILKHQRDDNNPEIHKDG